MILETLRERREGAAEFPMRGCSGWGGSAELQVDRRWRTGRVDTPGRGRAAVVAILDLGK
jgi:hypothetical protein